MKHFTSQLGQFLITLIALTILSSAQADAPSAQPVKISTKSSDGRIIVISTPRGGTTAYNVNGKLLWFVPGWHEEVLVPNNGTDLIVVYGGLNLIPKNYSTDLELITVWRSGKIFRSFRVRDIINDTSKLTETASHYFWGNIITLRGEKNIIINRCDGKQISLNYEDGRMKIIGEWMPADIDAKFQ